MIKPNLVSIVRFRDYKAEDAIVVPSLFIKQDFKGDYTYISDESNGQKVAKKVYVTTGVTNNNMTEVTKGLSAGMKIISEGYNQVASGVAINY
jgi:multidrug efflux pump subunit AcrA (membrane-fusion protein)